MEVFVVVLATLVVLLVLVRTHRRNVETLSAQRDDLRRAGDGLPPEDAALRATGTNAWMRPGGF